MAKRPIKPSIWNAGTFVNILAIPLITATLAGVGFYFTTQAILNEHTREIATAESNREKLRDALLANADQTQKALSQLTAHAMVQDEQIKSVTLSIDKMAASLQSFTAVAKEQLRHQGETK